MSIVIPSINHRYNLGPVKPWVESAAYFLGPRHGIKVIGGWRRTDPFPDHPSGHALDFMIPNLAVGQSLAQDAINNAGPLGVKYIIFNHRVWNPRQGWHPYTSTSNPHTDHVHITFNDQPGTGGAGGTVPAGGAVTGVIQGVALQDNTCAWHVGPTCVLSKTATRQLLGAMVIVTGAVIGVVGLVLLVGYGIMHSDTAKEASSLAGKIPSGKGAA